MIRSLPFALVVAAGLLLMGCSPGVKMVGTWEVDSEKLQADLAKSAGGNPIATLAAGMMSVVEVNLEFKSDGKFAATAKALGQSRTSGGTWRYKETDGDVMVLSMKADDEAAEREVRVRFTDWDHLEMVPPVNTEAPTGVGTFPFKRIKKT